MTLDTFLLWISALWIVALLAIRAATGIVLDFGLVGMSTRHVMNI